MTVMNIKEFKKIIKESKSFSEVSRKIYNNNYYGNRETIKKRIIEFNIDISHFEYCPNKKLTFPSQKIPISEMLVSGSTCGRRNLKYRLLKEDIKEHICELCGQGELWNGKKMSLILDHINGISNDNRLENLRIICPNCNATLSTHGGKNIKIKNKINQPPKKQYEKKTKTEIKLINQQRSINQRKVKRPPYEQLVEEINKFGYRATGRKYGVSDNAIRKWKKYYEKNENQ